jgi:predicted Ser/Thr protein kinase
MLGRGVFGARARDNGRVGDLQPGDIFAGCRVDGVLGRGGMGVVYRATDLRLGRPVALKLIAGDRASDPELRERFEREARLTAAIDHPNVVPVYAAGEEGGSLFLVMRYVAGIDLHALLQREGRLAPARAAEIVAQVADGLDAAHAAGLVHRDVKPANVLLSGAHVYLGDFGITRVQSADTRLTESGSWMGTVDFMSPEHLRGERTDARSDVYALGCLLYAALTGQPPFRRATVPATILAHLEDPPPRPSEVAGVPEAFDAVVARALAKDPADRFASAGEVGRAALAAAAGQPAPAAGDSVATGEAAPPAAADATAATRVAPTHVAPPPAPAPADATVRAREPAVPARAHRTSWRRRPALVALAALAAAAGAAAVAVALGGGGRSGPLDAGEVRGAARAFARAYGHEDRRALSRMLTTDASRVGASDVQRGRSAVVAEYERQFAANRTRGYDLTGLQVSGGRVGRASGRYAVRRAGRPPITGELVLGVVRGAGGEPRIRLITSEPRA